MKTNYRFIFATLVVFLTLPSLGLSQGKIELVDNVFDFGFVGIDFRIFHDFKLVNKGSTTIIVDSTEVPCDCSVVRHSTDTIAPGDTGIFKLTFDTKDFYGPVNRYFKIFLRAPEKRLFKVEYLTVVGQWVDGLKPEPLSIFMLPTQRHQTLRISNKYFEYIRAQLNHQFDNTFSVEILNKRAKKGEAIEIKVLPNPDLTAGTYLSNFTLDVFNSEEEKPAHLTIPVKIVRF